jgi:hypothetical protein
MKVERAVLSAEGSARREAILGEMVRAQRGRVAARFVTRSAAVGACMMIGLGAWAVLRPAISAPASPALRGPETAQRVPEREPAAGDGGVRIEIVSNDQTVVGRWTAAPAVPAAVTIGDSELQRLLERSGRAPGFVRASGRFLLASDIADPKAAAGRG